MAACKERYKKNESHTEGEQGTNWQQREKVTVLSEDEKDDGEGKEEIYLVFTAVWSSYFNRMLDIMEEI